MKTLREIIDATAAAIYEYNGVDVPDEVISRVELDMNASKERSALHGFTEREAAYFEWKLKRPATLFGLDIWEAACAWQRSQISPEALSPKGPK